MHVDNRSLYKAVIFNPYHSAWKTIHDPIRLSGHIGQIVGYIEANLSYRKIVVRYKLTPEFENLNRGYLVGGDWIQFVCYSDQLDLIEDYVRYWQ